MKTLADWIFFCTIRQDPMFVPSLKAFSYIKLTWMSFVGLKMRSNSLF